MVWALLLGLFLLFLTTLTRQSIINNNIVGMILGSLLSLIPFTVLFFYLMRWVSCAKAWAIPKPGWGQPCPLWPSLDFLSFSG